MNGNRVVTGCLSSVKCFCYYIAIALSMPFVSMYVLTVLCVKTVKFIKASKQRSQIVLDNLFSVLSKGSKGYFLVILINTFQVLPISMSVTVILT